MTSTDRKCDACGKQTVEETDEGFYCTSCRTLARKVERAVHHEGFPHVVSEEPEP